jgi:predicted phage terminase large subunit-like protein
MLDDLSPEAVAALLANLPAMPAAEKAQLLADLEALEDKRAILNAKTDFLAFCKRVYPEFKVGPHHKHMRPLLHKVATGEELRLTVSMAPRFGKSETISYLFVAWYLGQHPNHQIMMVTHTADLSATFGRKIRNMIDSEVYRQIFPDTVVSRDKSASGDWTTTKGGMYLAVGIGGSVAGRGAHLLIADDLVSEQAVLAGDPDKAFATAWEYVQVGPLQRLMPGGRIIMIGCMTAETRVLMADETEKEIQHIQVGDTVATYDNGIINTSRITNWIKHPSDFVYKITTTSGKIVRANKRHPFLVDRNGVRSWVRVRDLKVGDCLVVVVQPQAACDPSKPRGCASCATDENCEQMGDSGSAAQGIGVSGAVSNAQRKVVANPSLQKGCAKVATARKCGEKESTVSQMRKSVKATLNIGMVFLRKLTTLCAKAKRAVVQSVGNYQQERIQEQGKRQNSTSITVTTRTKLEGSCVTTATLLSGEVKHQKCLKPLQDTCDTIPDAIVEIVEDGYEPVFDMEVERTENFIANGVVSHNTRWGKKDPIGRALMWAENNPDSLPWNEVRFPAIMPSGKSLWPEQWPVEQLMAKKAGMAPQFWAAQYMQEPTSEEGALIKREWWRRWAGAKPPKCDIILQSWDTAHGKNDSSDPSAVTTWGVWFNEEENQDQIMLLDCWYGRKEFPELKKFAFEYYREWEPDMVVIEKKAAGAPLIQEMRATGLPIHEFTPSRGNDKRVRVNAVADMFSSGMVWAPETRWAQEVIDQVAEFPNGEFDDIVDTVSQALLRIRQGGLIRLASDEPDEPQLFRRARAAYY